jgi:putative ABC transport system permease protein
MEIAVERRLARELGLRVGDTVRLGATPDSIRTAAVIRAIYEPRPDPTRLMRGEQHVRFHLADLAGLLGTPDRVDRFGVILRPGVDPDSAVRRLNAPAFGYRAIPSSDVAAEASQTFAVVSRFHRAIGVISIVASAVFLLCIMLLKVEERRLDAAVMRFVGIGRRTIFTALVLEACMVALLGALLGTVLAWIGGGLTNAFYQWRFGTTLTFSALTPGIVLFGILLSLGLGMAAGAVASLRLIRTSPLALWRRG